MDIAKQIEQSHIDKLKLLKEMLENHSTLFPEVGFNMKDWYHSERTVEAQGMVVCNTAACALGSAACYKPLIERGLSLEPIVEDIYEGIKYYGENKCPSYILNGRKYEAFEAGEKFFGISEDEAEYLFNPATFGDLMPSEITPAMVADRVDRIIKEKEGEL